MPSRLSVSNLALAMSDPFGLWHDRNGDPAQKDPEDEYDAFLKEQGLRVERELLKLRHPKHVDLSDETFPAAVAGTRELIKKGGVVIHGGALEDRSIGVYGRPDVIVAGKGGLLVEEYKLAGTPTEAHKLQAMAYAWLLANAHDAVVGAVVVSRNNEESPVTSDHDEIEAAVQRAKSILEGAKAPYPNHGCARSRWSALQKRAAKEASDVSLAWNVGAVTGRHLHERGVHTLHDLAKLDAAALKAVPGLGPKKTPQLINSVKAQLSRKVVRTGEWTLPDWGSTVEIYLDLEGTGELFQDDPAWNCIYLIGMIARRKGKAGPYQSFLAKTPADEKACLLAFIAHLRELGSSYVLIHWFHYEKTQLKKACEKHDMLGEYEQWIAPHLFDLSVPAMAAFVLPISGWSIKGVAPYFGFEWSQNSSEVDAMKSSMMWFKQATTGGNGDGMDKVLKYNEDDCRAMIVALEGFQKLGRGSS